MLTHYFYTSAEVSGYKPPCRPTKLVLVARDAARADALLKAVESSLPAGSIVTPAFDRRFADASFSAALRGYEIERAAGAT